MFSEFAQRYIALLPIALIGLLVLKIVYQRALEQQIIRKHGKQAPRLTTWIPLGMSHAYKLLRAATQHTLPQYWTKNLAKLGSNTMELYLLEQRTIMTTDPENIKAILSTQFTDYGKGQNFHDTWHEFAGDSIFTTDGERWQASRQLIRPQFVKERVSDLHVFETHSAEVFKVIQNSNGVVDIADLAYRMTLDVSTEFLLGKSVGSLQNPKTAFAESFAEVQRIQVLLTLAGAAQNLVPRSAFRRHLAVINAFVAPYVDESLSLSTAELETKSKTQYSFVQALAMFTRDRNLLRDQFVAILLAARDTTAGTLSWCLYELAKNPHVVKRLRQEIIDKLGLEKQPNYADLKDLKYVQWILNETLRLYPAVPFNIRTALKDTSLPRGGGVDGLSPVGIAKGTPIYYSVLNMQRRTDLFGPDVEVFNPERWSSWTPKPWQFLPFNGGPRICIGQQMALTEMAYFLIRLFQKFESVESRETDVQFMKAEIVISPGVGVKVAFK